MTKLTLFFLFFSVTSFGQIKTDYAEIMPRDIMAKPLSDTVNYIDNSLRLSIAHYLKKKKLDPAKYFVDKRITEKNDTFYISLWDLDGLKRLKEIEIQDAKSEKQTRLVGNPGRCGTIYYDNKNKKLIGFYLWQ